LERAATAADGRSGGSVGRLDGERGGQGEAGVPAPEAALVRGCSNGPGRAIQARKKLVRASAVPFSFLLFLAHVLSENGPCLVERKSSA
jgi:hypothetical protein